MTTPHTDSIQHPACLSRAELHVILVGSWVFSLQALRIAYDGLNRQGSFEAVLREADSAEAPLKRSPQAGAAPLLDITLLNQPKVFTLALVWESAKVRLSATVSCERTACWAMHSAVQALVTASKHGLSALSSLQCTLMSVAYRCHHQMLTMGTDRIGTAISGCTCLCYLF